METRLIEKAGAFLEKHADGIAETNHIERTAYKQYDVKRGLRNADGTGVMAGLTRIGNVRGYYMQDGEKCPMPGQLFYRGINLVDLVQGFLTEGRFGYEETAYLILFGSLPSADELAEFSSILAEYRELPDNFTENMILASPSVDIMNKLARSVLSLYSYDPKPEPNGDITKELDKSLRLIACTPVIVANAFAAKRHYYDNESLHLHRPNGHLSLAENFLYSVRNDNLFTAEEARLLDLCLVVHAEHGGGNNSAFACRVLSSSGTDIYSAIAAAVGSLKGPKHGGANMKVMEMFECVKRDVRDWNDDEELHAYLRKILRKEAGLGDGLIYGMGHAVYTMSDPRADLLKDMARELAGAKGFDREFALLEAVERLAPAAFVEEGRGDKVLCANVDMYSGLVYQMLDIPCELYTPLFATARMVGWCAHRIEEIANLSRIMRPAYKALIDETGYRSLDDRS